MGRPHKGERVSFTLRVPAPIVEAISALDVADRNAFVVTAIEDKLAKDNANGPA